MQKVILKLVTNISNFFGECTINQLNLACILTFWLEFKLYA